MKESDGQSLSFQQLTVVGIKTGAAVGAITGPLEKITTNTFLHGVKTKSSQTFDPLIKGPIFSKDVFKLNPPGEIVKKFYRGGPLGILTTIINNVASSYLKDFLDNRFPSKPPKTNST